MLGHVGFDLFSKRTVKNDTCVWMPMFIACDIIYLTQGWKLYTVIPRRSEKGVGQLGGKGAYAFVFRHVQILQTKETIKTDK